MLQLPAGKDPDEFLRDHGAGDYRSLLDGAPLWLDWQIEQQLQDRDLSQSDQFQQAVTALVTLLGRLPQSAVRSRYLQQVAERLSGGQARLARSLEDDLRRQVQGQRWHGRASRWEQPGSATTQERAETDLLRLYLHCPDRRGVIRQQLRQWEQEDFMLQQHRRLWAAIGELEEDNLGSGRLEAISRGEDGGEDLAELDLPRLLSDRLLIEDSSLLDRLTPLLQPSEVQRLSLEQPLLLLRGALALRARLATEKRCRHLLDAWSSQRLRTLEHCIAHLLEQEQRQTAAEASAAASGGDAEARIEALFLELNGDALRFQEAYYSERRYLSDLDQRRCAGYEEIVAQARSVA